VDRRQLGAAVFGKPEALARLNAIVWPEVETLARARFNDLRAAAAAAGTLSRPVVGVLEAALLIEAGWGDRLDELWMTHIADDEVIARLVARNGITPDAARLRLASQPPASARLAHATVVIDTSGAKDATKRLLDAQWRALLARLPTA